MESAANALNSSSNAAINLQQQQQQQQQSSQQPPASQQEEAIATCTVLCSLGGSSTSASATTSQEDSSIACASAPVMSSTNVKRTNKGKPPACPKQLQLPMFLSKTYHMIDKCDIKIATWSDEGDNFVVKNVEKFASAVLPLYFKHSNFSSFARQLNFYGFRKLRTDPILTSEVDPCTACHVRFYHEHFQRDKPELLQNIKRATKGGGGGGGLGGGATSADTQALKEEVDSLKQQVKTMQEALSQSNQEFDRKLAALSYECNRRITSMNAEYDRLHAMVQAGGAAAAAAVPQRVMLIPAGSLPTVAAPTTAATAPVAATTAPTAPIPATVAATPAAIAAAAAATPATAPQHATIVAIPQGATDAGLLHSLSQAAVSLQSDQTAKRPAQGAAPEEPAAKKDKECVV